MTMKFLTGFFKGKPKPETKVISVTSERTGERTLLGVENFLGSIAVPEPFSLEIAGDAAGVALLARCRDGSFVRQQLGVHYRHARVSEVSQEDDPLRLAPGEQAWSMDLRLAGAGVPAPAHLQGRRPAGPGFRPSNLGHRFPVRPGAGRTLGSPAAVTVPGAGVVPLPPGESPPPIPARPCRFPLPRPGPGHPHRRGPLGRLRGAGPPGLPVGPAGGDLEGGAPGHRHGGGAGRGGLGLVAHQEGPAPAGGSRTPC